MSKNDRHISLSQVLSLILGVIWLMKADVEKSNVQSQPRIETLINILMLFCNSPFVVTNNWFESSVESLSII